jgi:DNA-binding Lrp family transcriptional regulator
VKKDRLNLLFKLQEKPVAPATELARDIGVTPPTVRSWLAKLRKEKVFVSVPATLRVKKLGLEMYDYTVRVESHDALTKIEKFCDAHPYTSYRARVFGGSQQGMLLQFRQPPSARTYLEDALAVMKEKGIISDVRELPTLRTEYGSAYTRPKLDAWNPDRMVWKFDWDDWWQNAPDDFEEYDQAAARDNSLIEIDKLDVQLLEEITKDARQKNIEMIRSIGRDPEESGLQQSVSARIKKLKKEVIESYRIFINWTHFDVYNTPMLIVRASERVTDQLIHYLIHSDFPFGSSIRPIKQGFVWSARMPSAHLSELVSLVWKISKGFELLMIDYKHSQMYALWSEAWDADGRAWKVGREFCLDSPMNPVLDNSD